MGKTVLQAIEDMSNTLNLAPASTIDMNLYRTLLSQLNNIEKAYRQEVANIPPTFADALIVRPEWGDLILDGMKTWEIRGCDTKKRGTFFLAYSGTGLVYGQFDLVDSLFVTLDDLKSNENKHRIGNSEMVMEVYDTPHAWVIENARRYEKPFAYTHPQGAVIWVKGVERKEV